MLATMMGQRLTAEWKLNETTSSTLGLMCTPACRLKADQILNAVAIAFMGIQVGVRLRYSHMRCAHLLVHDGTTRRGTQCSLMSLVLKARACSRQEPARQYDNSNGSTPPLRQSQGMLLSKLRSPTCLASLACPLPAVYLCAAGHRPLHTGHTLFSMRLDGSPQPA